MNTLDVTDGIVPRRRRFEAYRTFVMCPPALTLHFGVVISLEVFNFANRLLKVGMSVVNGDTRFVHDRNLVRRTPTVNGERRTVEVLAFSHVIDCVNDYPDAFDKRLSNYHIDGDIWTSRDHESRFVVIRSLVW